MRHDDEIDVDESIGDRQAREANRAPQEQPQADAQIAAQQHEGAQERDECAEEVDRPCHAHSSLLISKARANSRTAPEAFEWILCATAMRCWRYAVAARAMRWPSLSQASS